MYAPHLTTGQSLLVRLEEQKELLEIDQQALRDIICKCPSLTSIEMDFLPPGGSHMRYRYAESTRRHLQAILSVLAAARCKHVPIQRVQIDLFHSLQSPDELGLRQQLEEGLLGVIDLQLRGQYRFWETVLELDIYAHMTFFTLSDSTVVYDTLHALLCHRGHQLQRVTLDRVGFLPYPQLGYVSHSGTRQEMISWLFTVQTEALQMLRHGRSSPLAMRE